MKRVVLLWLVGSALGAQATPSPALLALSKTDLTLAIVNPATSVVIARMPSGPDPHEVVASSDGRFAYIANYGGGAYNTLTVVDLVNQKTVETVDLGALRGPHGLTFVGGKSGSPPKPRRRSAATTRRPRKSISCSGRGRIGRT